MSSLEEAKILEDNGTLHEWSEVVKDFTPECGGINQGMPAISTLRKDQTIT